MTNKIMNHSRAEDDNDNLLTLSTPEFFQQNIQSHLLPSTDCRHNEKQLIFSFLKDALHSIPVTRLQSMTLLKDIMKEVIPAEYRKQLTITKSTYSQRHPDRMYHTTHNH